LAHFEEDKLLKIFQEHGVSEHNQEIAIDYLLSIKRIGRSQSTMNNNVDFVKWLVLNFDGDLDKLTRRDVNKIQDKINELKRKKDGKPAADTTKQLYKISLKRFLKKYGREIDNRDMARLADFEMAPAKPTRLKPEDILTDEELNKIILNCKTLRDRACVALLAETGARVGEIEHCKLGDVKPAPHGFYITLRGKTGERQVIVYKCQQLLRQWINVHPEWDNPDSPLFPTQRKYDDNSFTNSLTVGELPRAYRPLNGKQIGIILKLAAAASGIEKKVHPHLLRHTAATMFANSLTEQQMKVQLGWTPSSPMPGRYSHVAEADVEKKLLTLYGCEIVRDIKGEIVRKCPRCSKPITAGLNYCECGMPLTDAEIREFNRLLNDEDFKLTMVRARRVLEQMDLETPEEKPKKDDDWW
jgi:integrase